MENLLREHSCRDRSLLLLLSVVVVAVMILDAE